GPDGAQRVERLFVAQRVSPVLSHAWQQSLARDRYPAEGVAGQAVSDVRRTCSVAAQGSQPRTLLQIVQLVFDLSDSSSVHRALQGSPLLLARRCGARPQSDGRSGHEYRTAGCLQPGLEARAGCVGTSRFDAARLV